MFMRIFPALVSVALVVISYQNCSGQKVHFSEAASEGYVDSNGTLYKKELICGGARALGKHFVPPATSDACTLPVTADNSCDRWGCAEIINASGDAGCPAGTETVYTGSPDLQYFLCVRKVPKVDDSVQVCGGTRRVGKWQTPETCTRPVTTDNSCNRWGCAIVVDPTTGNSFCPADKVVARISDAPTSVLCLEP